MARLDPRRLPAFLADPGEVRVVLFHGDDAGLARERADQLTRAVSGGDELAVVEIPREAARETGLLAAEAAMLPLLGGRRVVRVREASDAFAAAAEAALAGPGPGIVVMEAPDLPARSRLRALLEAAPQAMVIACWRERGAELAASIRRILEELGVSAEPAAVEWLAEQLGEDRQRLRRELEKLALFVGPGGRASAEDVLAAVAGGNSWSLEEALAAAFLGDVAGADRALEAAFSSGAQAVTALRAALRHTQRLLEAAMEVAQGASPRAAVEALRPPVFFRARPAMERALAIWRVPALEALGAGLYEAERRAKSSGVPDVALARQALLAIAQRAAAGRGGGV
ncbi:MAG: DNA polymerase III subunit delta [Rhodovarius sp.]|nr:DNA polymerase III subunit delta [Rhodovarius sp.]